MIRFITVTVVAGLIALVAGCAGGPSSAGAGSGSITMYGTIDEGVTVHN
ncbi:hypothetical protein [Caballeronia sp. HLA56]